MVVSTLPIKSKAWLIYDNPDANLMNRSSDLDCLASGWGLIEDLSDSVRDNFIDLSSGSFQLSSACYGGRD